jgi:UPF0755 protein
MAAAPIRDAQLERAGRFDVPLIVGAGASDACGERARIVIAGASSGAEISANAPALSAADLPSSSTSTSGKASDIGSPTLAESTTPPPPSYARESDGKSPPPSRRRTLFSLLVLLILCALIAADFWQQLHAPMAIATPTTAELNSGERFDRWLDGLTARGLFANPRQRWYLSIYARFSRATALIRAGEYPLEVGATPLEILSLLKSGKVILHELRLIEGWRFAQAWQTIQNDLNVQHTLAAANAAEVMRALGKPELSAEGQFFPDTYRFPKNTADITLLRQANTALEKILAAEWSSRAANLPYDSPQRALVMASIIEKETAAPAERAMIAGVFVRRLQMGMRLQTDPAVIYGLGEAYDGSIHTRDLQTDTPYNTYLRAGLPPTPICLPGRDSIHAALHPDDGQALYFVSRGDGTHQFSDTLAEHNAAVHRYVPGAR